MSPEGDPTQERRRAERFSMPGGQVEARILQFSPPGARVEAKRKGTFVGLFGGGPDLGGEMLDLSSIGLRFVSSQKLAIDSHMKLTVTFAQIKDRLECTGTVRWSHAHGRPGQFVAGVEFDRLSGDQISVLERVQKEIRKQF